MRRIAAALMCLLLVLLLPAALAQEEKHSERALLIGVDEFVSRPSAYPSSANNVSAVQEMLKAAAQPPDAVVVPQEPVTSAQQLAALIRDTFEKALPGDINYLYISTHGLYDPQNGVEPQLLLSDGIVEGSVNPAQLEAAFDGIAGTKVIILDACNSGAFIGKGLAFQPEELYFTGEDFKVLTSSGALEESWYWNREDGGVEQGAFYFTQALTQALSPAFDFPADQNRDGAVTLSELHQHLSLEHAASTPQVYPQKDNFVVFRYDKTKTIDRPRSAVMDVTFSGNILSRQTPEITIEFIAMRPIQIGYQIVYQREGKWQFDQAQIIYDEAERFTLFGDRAGAVSAGRKVRTLTIGDLPEDAYGYVLVQLFSIENGQLTVHAGRVLCVPPENRVPDISVSVPEGFDPASGRELCIFVEHDAPCLLSVSVKNEEGKTVHRLCHKQSTRPMQLSPEGSVFYWDGTLKNGQSIPPGTYSVVVQAYTNDQSVQIISQPITIHQGG